MFPCNHHLWLLAVATGFGLASCQGIDRPIGPGSEIEVEPDAGTDADDPCGGEQPLQVPCYSGPPGTQDIGECRGGLSTVDCETGEWGPCQGEVLPAEERCDALDRDCDGTTDDAARERGPLCEKQVGVCAGSRRHCEAGTWVPCTDDDYAAASELYSNSEAGLCDGIDNDCDGMVDPIPPCTCPVGLTHECYSGPPETVDVGVCHAGTMTCQENGWGSCKEEVFPQDEICDGVDNDCDGWTDEDGACDAEADADAGAEADADAGAEADADAGAETEEAPLCLCASDEDCGPPDLICEDCACVTGCGVTGCPGGYTCDDATGRCAVRCVHGGWEGDNRITIRTADDLARLVGYTTVVATLAIEDSVLKDLRGLECLETLAALEIRRNPDLRDLSGLDHLRDVDIWVYIEDNPALVSLEGLGGLESAGTVESHAFSIRNNDTLQSLDGLDGTAVAGSLSIADNDALVRIGSRARLLSVSGAVRIIHNPSLESLAGLRVDSLASVNIERNPSLRDLRGLEGLQAIRMLFIGWNDGLVDLTGLGDLGRVDGSLTLLSLPELASLQGLESLDRIEGSLSVYGCDRLADLSGLAQLQRIGMDLRVTENDALTRLSGLESLAGLGEDLQIRNNPELPTCEAELLRDRLADQGWAGTATLDGNDDEGTCE